MLYIGKQLLHHLIDIGIGLAEARIGLHSLYFLDCFNGFSVRHIAADFKGYSILPHRLTRKTLNAVVIVIPISAQNASNCRFKSASIRMLIFVFAIGSNSFHSYYIHCITFYLQCQYMFLTVYPSTGP